MRMRLRLPPGATHAVLLMLLATSACDGGKEGEQTALANPATPEFDELGRELVPGLGLVKAPGYELVAANCVQCHGPRQFLQQRADRDTWLGIIRWMQRQHGLWTFPPNVENGILDYLSTHYAPGRAGRRPLLPPALMPPNPYAPAAPSGKAR